MSTDYSSGWIVLRNNHWAMLRIHDILVWIRIRIRIRGTDPRIQNVIDPQTLLTGGVDQRGLKTQCMHKIYVIYTSVLPIARRVPQRYYGNQCVHLQLQLSCRVISKQEYS